MKLLLSQMDFREYNYWHKETNKNGEISMISQKHAIALYILLLALPANAFSLSELPASVKDQKLTQKQSAKLSHKTLIRNFEIVGTALIATGYGLSLLNLRSDSMQATARQTAAVGFLSGGCLLLASLFTRNIWNNAYKNSVGKKTESFQVKNLINCLDKNLAAALVFSVMGFRWLKEIKRPLKTFAKQSRHEGDFTILDQD
jgi:hypothetical protein